MPRRTTDAETPSARPRSSSCRPRSWVAWKPIAARRRGHDAEAPSRVERGDGAPTARAPRATTPLTRAAAARAAEPSRSPRLADSRPLFVSSGAERSSAWPTVLAGEHAEDDGHAGDERRPPRCPSRTRSRRSRSGRSRRGSPRRGPRPRRSRPRRWRTPARSRGSSKAPGTHATVTSAGSTPRPASCVEAAVEQPRRDRPLNRAHATPTRSPRPSPSPSKRGADERPRGARAPLRRAPPHPTTPSSPSSRWPMRSRLVRR